MSQPNHSDAAVASSSDSKPSQNRFTDRPDRPGPQDTLLLSDVPEASALMPEAQSETAGAPSVPLPKPQLPTLDLTPLSQRYELLAEAGHGSMGNVYKARDRETGETVALKLLKPEIASDQTMMERFKKELLFARKITHKNVCRVHEFNRIGGIAYTSMEFVEGESLRSVLNRFGGLPLRKALDLSQQMCSALQEAHVQGIVHRDLKPENVMVDTQGNVKIMDFGIARSIDAMTRLTGSMVGTPAYMAPEQVSGKQVDFRTDIYALGLILYEVFTGQPAFQAENAVAVALKQMREAPKPLHEMEPSIPFGIERAIMKCLQKDPTNRFQSVSQLGDALRAPSSAGPTNASAAPPAASLPIASAGVPLGRSTNSTGFNPHPLYGASALSMPEPKHTSKSAWVLLAVLLASGAYAAMHWNEVIAAEREYAPLTVSAAKYYYAQAKSFAKGSGSQNSSQADVQPNAQAAQQSPAQDAAAPDNSATDSAATKNSPVNPEDSKLSAAPSGSATPEPASPKTSEKTSPVTPSVTAKDGTPQPPASASQATAASAATSAPNPKGTISAASSPAPKKTSTKGNTAPSAVQRRADPAFGEQTLSVPPVNDSSPTYLWIGRFELEDRAQERARKIEDLGLPVVVIPRHSGGDSFFVVLSGPFGPERVGSVMDWLKEQGFTGIRVVKNPLRNGRLVPGVEQDPEE
jgi:serine/threonine protein kinase